MHRHVKTYISPTSPTTVAVSSSFEQGTCQCLKIPQHLEPLDGAEQMVGVALQVILTPAQDSDDYGL